MDRRQRKTREAIFHAFLNLLSKKDFEHITVGEIINAADIGRATFYAHFETKDFLLKALCEELFCHIFDATEENSTHKHIFACDAPDSVFLHLFEHLQKNDNHILELLFSQNNTLFLNYFKSNLTKLIRAHMDLFENDKTAVLPESYRTDHIAATFVESVRWWVNHGKKESPETMAQYFFTVL